MPTYEYRCSKCGYEFDKLYRTFEEAVKTKEVYCPECQSLAERLLSSPIISMGSEKPKTDWGREHEEEDYYKKRKDHLALAKLKEREGKSDWEVKEEYRKAGKKI
ncbi:MAG: zinc ribbon domain-containing protein [Candidatus Aenigmarchaeota archaeon]|nr:zinc ribbon domain-containing protein [Candidatus Aenigmarchaeota archaeon]